MKASTRWLLAPCLILASQGGITAQVTPVPRDEARTIAEIRIDLPDAASRVEVEPHDRSVRLVLPRGSQYPLDFASSSGGLLSGGEVRALGDDRVVLQLELAAGLLDRVLFEPGALVLRFASYFEVTTDDPDLEGRYVLGADDRVLVTIHNHPDLTKTLAIGRDGTITAPLVGDLQAAGLTPRQLAARVAELLGRSYLVDPKVDVSVEQYRSQWVMVTGEVRNPGRIPLKGGTRLKEVLSEALGFASTAGEEIVVSRRVPGTNEFTAERYSRSDFELGFVDPPLSHGDIVEVAKASYCYVQGEVRSPSRVPVERGLTLLKAITMVGGLTEWADLKQVRVLYGEGHDPAEKVFNLKRIREGRADDPPLTGGEVVVVNRRFL